MLHLSSYRKTRIQDGFARASVAFVKVTVLQYFQCCPCALSLRFSIFKKDGRFLDYSALSSAALMNCIGETILSLSNYLGRLLATNGIGEGNESLSCESACP